MDRTRRVEKLLGMLAYAEADTAEGRAARTLADRFQARHRITEQEVAEARYRRERRSLSRVTLDGWSEPWLVDVAFLVASVSGCRAQLGVTPGGVLLLELVGQGAGVAEDRARSVRAVVDAAVARAGGEEGIRRLRVRQRGGFGGLMFVGGFNSAATTWNGGLVGGESTLAGLHGDNALTVYRMMVTRRVLGPDLERFAREAEEAARREQEARQAAMREKLAGRAQEGRWTRPSSPTPAGEGGAGASGTRGEEPRVEAPPTPRVEADEEAMRVRQRAQDLMRRTLALAQRADEASQGGPAWLGDAVPVVPGGLVVRCA